MARQTCEDCKWFDCTGYHSYICTLTDDENRGPFDTPCNSFESKR